MNHRKCFGTKDVPVQEEVIFLTIGLYSVVMEMQKLKGVLCL